MSGVVVDAQMDCRGWVGRVELLLLVRVRLERLVRRGVRSGGGRLVSDVDDLISEKLGRTSNLFG